ncbi:hypothetical protein [Enterococcus xiangfangensis]|uniref:hypothetical protein n=1 Tax=Enterococcus xiangfangensis TaxID=1296537 RepID=UPI0010F546AF|nr:hypothetical protein [Enterococcus xiangfangensis]MBM7710550.1 hypothetical protein [Enterococcus xiangfangensis]
MKKKVILFLLLFLVSTLSGCSNDERKNQIIFTKDKFKVDELGNVHIKGYISGMSEGNYKANIDRDNQNIYLNNKGKFEIDSFILSNEQKEFSIGVETPEGEIVVGSTPLDTKDFAKALKLKEYISPQQILDMYKDSSLSVENQEIIIPEQTPFKIREGIIFSDGSDKSNNEIRVFSFNTKADFKIAKEYYLNESKWLPSKEQFNISQLLQIPVKKKNSDISSLEFRYGSLDLKKMQEIFDRNPLYGSRIASNEEKKIILICENGIHNAQFNMYNQIIDTLESN